MATQTSFQERLASRVVIWGAGFVAVYSAVAVIAVALTGDGKETADTAKGILGALLPVVGTWIGSVLAFYFGKENYRAAAEEARLSLGQRLSKLALAEAVPANSIKSFTVKSDTEALALTLDKLRAEFERIKPFYRLPLLLPDGVVVYILHRQPLDSFLADQSPTPAKELTFGDLLLSSHGERVRHAAGFVSKAATLGEAKSHMEAKAHCQDVFITESGKPTERVLGWLTNNAIQEAATA